MAAGEPANVLDFYADHFVDGMTDLSSAGGGRTSDGLASVYPRPGGSPALRKAIASLYPHLGPEHIVVTNGASEALVAVALTFVQPGMRVAAAPGSYPSFVALARGLGAQCDWADAPPATARLWLVNNPTVPDGRLIAMEAAAKAAAAAGTRLVADEVYLPLGGASPGLPAVSIAPEAISIGDLSKPLGLAGLRIGWAASRDTVALAAVSRAVALLSGGPSAIAMEAAVDSVGEYEVRLRERQATAGENGADLFAALREAGWAFEPPQAGWTFIASPGRPLSREVEERIRRAGLFLVPTSAFGLEAGGYRLSLLAPVVAVRQALGLAAAGGPPAAGRLVVLAKAPRPGFAKTRLAAGVGERAAALIARACLEDTLALARASGRATTIAFTPRESAIEFTGEDSFADLVAQPDGDLGVRISAAFCRASGQASTVLIGMDTPQLPPRVIEEAFAALRCADLALGPATDGGFYLIGARAPLPQELFSGVDWSTPTVFAAVSRNAARAGLRVAVLEELTDIDDLGSLRAALGRAEEGVAPRTLAAARQMGLFS